MNDRLIFADMNPQLGCPHSPADCETARTQLDAVRDTLAQAKDAGGNVIAIQAVEQALGEAT